MAMICSVMIIVHVLNCVFDCYWGTYLLGLPDILSKTELN